MREDKQILLVAQKNAGQDDPGTAQAVAQGVAPRLGAAAGGARAASGIRRGKGVRAARGVQHGGGHERDSRDGVRGTVSVERIGRGSGVRWRISLKKRHWRQIGGITRGGMAREDRWEELNAESDSVQSPNTNPAPMLGAARPRTGSHQRHPAPDRRARHPRPHADPAPDARRRHGAGAPARAGHRRDRPALAPYTSTKISRSGCGGRRRRRDR